VAAANGNADRSTRIQAGTSASGSDIRFARSTRAMVQKVATAASLTPPTPDKQPTVKRHGWHRNPSRSVRFEFQ